ncbi:MAG: hypothetical protein RID25_25900, partial [Cyclobacteriaceae bacterium]
RLDQIIKELSSYMTSISEDELRKKPAPGKWSKIEILGKSLEIIDTGIYQMTEDLYFTPLSRSRFFAKLVF